MLPKKTVAGVVGLTVLTVALSLRTPAPELSLDKIPVASPTLAPVPAPVPVESDAQKWPLNPPTLIRIVDGDTAHFMVDGEDVCVRFLRINTTERGKPGYKEGTEALRGFLTGKSLRLEYEVGGVKAKDRYGRDLAYVYADGVNVNLAMVRTGWTKFYVKYGKGKYQKLFEDAEKEAREAKLGLWQDGFGSGS